MSEKLISGTIASQPEIVDITINNEQFNLLSMLVDICCIFQASSADCKRGFSLMNLNASRTVDLHKAYTVWKDHYSV